MSHEQARIPASHTEKIVNDTVILLLWVRTGTARVLFDRSEAQLSAGDALWIPPGIRHEIHTDDDSVVVPLLHHGIAIPSELQKVIQLTVPPGWSDWLLLQFAHTLGYLRGAALPGPRVLERMSATPAMPDDTREHTSDEIAPPSMPRSRAAQEVAMALTNDPADAMTLASFAAKLSVGERTLQQQFSSETGMSFTHWRTASRVSAAAQLLLNGYRTTAAGQLVGFKTPAGFTRAFRERTGTTPRVFLQIHRETRTKRAEGSAALRALVTRGERLPTDASAHQPPRFPATQSWERVNNFDILVWVYRGRARVRIGDQHRTLRRGDSIILPAGISNSIDIAEDSLVFPVATRLASPVPTKSTPRVMHIPLATEDRMLHAIVSFYTLLRPAGYEPEQIIRDIIAAQRGSGRSQRPLLSTDPVQQVIAGLHTDPADNRTLEEWALALGVPPTELRMRFAAATATTFPRWRSALRMTRARESLMNGGRAIADIAQHLGYSSASSFDEVFAAHHGMSPTAFRRERLRAASAPSTSGSSPREENAP